MLSLSKAIQSFKDDPSHWTNNKRRMHGLPLLRKSANRKSRFSPSRNEYMEVMRVLDAIAPELVRSTIAMMVDISDFPFGIVDYYRGDCDDASL